MTLKSEKSFDRQLRLVVLLIRCCECALRFTDVATLRHSLGHARKSYAAALRNAGLLSLTVRNVYDFEVRTLELEGAIGRLDHHCRNIATKSPILFTGPQ